MKLKHKTHKGLSKRVKVTANGKVKRKASFSGHLLSGKNGNRRRRIGRPVYMAKRDTERTLLALGISK